MSTPGVSGKVGLTDGNPEPVETATALPKSDQTVNLSARNVSEGDGSRECAPPPPSDVTPRNSSGIPSTTEQRSVSVAKPLPKVWPTCAWPGCESNACAPWVYCTPHAGEVAAGTPAAQAVLARQNRMSEMQNGVAVFRACAVPGCGCLLGVDVVGDLCSVHRREAMVKCARKGCQRPHTEDSAFCRGHDVCAESASCDNLPAISDELPEREEGTHTQVLEHIISLAISDELPERGEGCGCCHVGQPCTCCDLHRNQQRVYLHTEKQPKVGDGIEVEYQMQWYSAEVVTDSDAVWGVVIVYRGKSFHLNVWKANRSSWRWPSKAIPASRANPEEHEQPNDGYQSDYLMSLRSLREPKRSSISRNSCRSKVASAIARDFVRTYEMLWMSAADDEKNDPVTVARCKQLSDDGVATILNLLSDVL